MVECDVTIINPLGLHARAAAKLVRLSRNFVSQILIIEHRRNATANAKSILSILAIAAPVGSSIRITAEGADEREALDAVCALFADGFGEI